jgi:hypothetical protein
LIIIVVLLVIHFKKLATGGCKKVQGVRKSQILTVWLIVYVLPASPCFMPELKLPKSRDETRFSVQILMQFSSKAEKSYGY